MPVRTFDDGIIHCTIIAEFDSTKAAEATVTSDAYKVAALRGDIDRDVRVIDKLK